MSEPNKASAVSNKAATVSRKAPSEDEIKAQEPLMYVGPTIPGIAIQNTVYEPIPEAAREAAKGLPVLLDLFVPIRRYPDAERQLRDKTGRFYSAFTKAFALKNKGGKQK